MIPYLSLILGFTFIPHGHCYLWHWELVSLHVIADAVIGFCYYSIPALILYFVRQRLQDIPYPAFFLLFAAFILCCGTSHLMEIWTLWYPHYWLSGAIKALTAAVSLVTVFMIFQVMPLALALPSPGQLEEANRLLAAEIQERQEAEAELIQAHQTLKFHFENTPLAVVEWDSNMQVHRWSERAEHIFGWRPEDVLKKHPSEWQFIHPEDLPEVSRIINQLWDGSQPRNTMVNRNYKKDGSVVHCEWYNSVLFDEAGKVVSIISLVQDTTQRVLAEEKLREKTKELETAISHLQRTQAQLIQSEKMSSLGQLVAGIAHEINNPVNFIYANIIHAHQYLDSLLELLGLYSKSYNQPVREIQEKAEEIDLDYLVSDLPKLISSMRSGAERIRSIVTSLRTFSRLDESDLKAVDIHSGIDSALMILQHRLNPNDIHIKNGMSGIVVIKEYGNLPQIECYPGQLNQAIINLINNAIDALEDSKIPNAECQPQNLPDWPASFPLSVPTITIKTELIDPHRVAIYIADNGPGIPESVKQRMFDPFFTTKPVGKGTGLGLSISYQIVVDKHQGRLECFSTPGQGAQFTIELPVQQKLPGLAG
ncbi:MAG TPA: PAS domain S-box protein [Oscillatoriaceae cyanobacterium M33_DOE_052]|uniref:histidine kinase n=1 Tax=Planktothricoides sp. SpSt-374 TaxID=2282167 RepID=A0A7C3VKW0_9CYAN|nr:PAS domain S-box protein [Oscillatoriaceae cyanobacterium M33_DOE_052]